MPDHHDRTVGKSIAIGQAELQRPVIRGIQLDLLPAVTEVGGAEQVPAQAIDQQTAGLAGAKRAKQ
ncbi:hypothetical protein D3C71_2086550 [compost metagenome]